MLQNQSNYGGYMDTQDFISKWNAIGEQHFRSDNSNTGRFNFGSAAYDFLFLKGMPSEFQDLNFDYLKEKNWKPSIKNGRLEILTMTNM
jgi:hypothetical protein